MKPFSRTQRRGYQIFLFLVFIVGAPLFILDAKGYRLNWDDVIQVSQTGGLYISTEQSGIEIFVNNELVKKTSIVQKSIFVQDLKPGVYEIRVSKEGLQSWNKTLHVFPEIVTEARSFLIKEDPELTPIPRFLDVGGAVSSTSPKKSPQKNTEYDVVNALFIAPPAKPVLTKFGTSSPSMKISSDVVVNNNEGKLHVRWMGEEDSIPNYFCENVTCKSEIIIAAPSKILSFDFFPGSSDLLIIRLLDGIYVSEIDDRSPQNIKQIVSGSGFDFRVKDGKNIYLKQGAQIYAVSP